MKTIKELDTNSKKYALLNCIHNWVFGRPIILDKDLWWVVMDGRQQMVRVHHYTGRWVKLVGEKNYRRTRSIEWEELVTRERKK